MKLFSIKDAHRLDDLWLCLSLLFEKNNIKYFPINLTLKSSDLRTVSVKSLFIRQSMRPSIFKGFPILYLGKDEDGRMMFECSIFTGAS